MPAHFITLKHANVLHPSSPLWIFGGASPRGSKLRASFSPSPDAGDSYLDMWKKAVARDRKSMNFLKISDERPKTADESKETVERKTKHFNKITSVPKEERDRVQRLQVIDRASAAIAAARALLRDSPPRKPPSEDPHTSRPEGGLDRVEMVGGIIASAPVKQGTSVRGAPVPDSLSWSPPANNRSQQNDNVTSLRPAKLWIQQPNASYSIMEKERSETILWLPFETRLEKQQFPILPPLQSSMEVEKSKTESSVDLATVTSEALLKSNEGSFHGVNFDGSKWWSESGVDQRPDGIVCKWTLNRGLSKDGRIEWKDKFWEASDRFEYKELGSEKSGHDADGNVWREYWRESMQQDPSNGLMRLEKTGDKWGRNAKGDEWQEEWWEHHDDSGHTEKWAHKWCCIDLNTPLDAGHAHTWHERWGEKHDGEVGSAKYTDKWSERSEGCGGWSKWGDKWDERFDPGGRGVKQGETWWEGRHGERWNRTWGEEHDGAGRVHKYGKSSSGEHWDTHSPAQEIRCNESYPHHGFLHCFENSPQLRAVKKPDIII
ncbi:hypothetical protein KSP39_PZI012300 [Platanthera zijinensis]|uniref:Uncharacterized protein n=1 Tax=Platanthera zijinensis TaxID=2320716 RepID=A0AAP0BGB0_9ASPA